MPKTNQAGVAHLVLIVLLLLAVGAGVFLVGQRTNFLPSAALSGPVSSPPISGPVASPSPKICNNKYTNYIPVLSCGQDSYRIAVYQCSDGYTGLLGGFTSCSTNAALQNLANQACGRRIVCASPSPVPSPSPSRVPSPSPSPVGSITITYPNGGETFSYGQTINITWTRTAGTSNIYNLIYVNEFGISFPIAVISDPATRSWSWKISNNLPLNPGNTTRGKIRIASQLSNNISDESNSLFTITNPITPSPIPSPASQTITIRAKGDHYAGVGGPNMYLKMNGTVYKTWPSIGKSYTDYSFVVPQVQYPISVGFPNDLWNPQGGVDSDINLYVDYIKVGNKVIQGEDPNVTYKTNHGPVYPGRDYLWWAGELQFPVNLFQ